MPKKPDPTPASGSPIEALTEAVAELAGKVAELAAKVAELKTRADANDVRDERAEKGLTAVLRIVGGADSEKARADALSVRQSIDHDEHVAELTAAGEHEKLATYLSKKKEHDERQKRGKKSKAEQLAELRAKMDALQNEAE